MFCFFDKGSRLIEEPTKHILLQNMDKDAGIHQQKKATYTLIKSRLQSLSASRTIALAIGSNQGPMI